MQLSDGRDRRTRINGAWTIPSFSAALCLASVGPSPVMSSSRTAFPPAIMCHLSSSTLSPRWPFPRLIIHSSLSMCPAPFHISLSPKSKSIISHLPPFSPVVFHHVPSSVALLAPRHFFHALIVRRHHSCHAPHSSHWPPRLFIKAIQLFQVAARGFFHISKC
jgi:hypothetical protein